MKKMFMGIEIMMVVFIISFTAAAQQARVALVIGNDAYAEFQQGVNLFDSLNSSVNDAKKMATVLHQYGFEVTTLTDASMTNMKRAVDAFISKLQPGNVALFFFSGHGVQVQNENYLIPVGRDFADSVDVQEYAITANWILNKLRNSHAQVKIMLLDACRDTMPELPDDEKLRKGFEQRGLAKMGASGVFIGYAASPGETALSESGGYSFMTKYFIDAMYQFPQLSIEMVFKHAANAVYEATKTRKTPQQPWSEGIIRGDFCFDPKGRCLLASAMSQPEPTPTAISTPRPVKKELALASNPSNVMIQSQEVEMAQALADIMNIAKQAIVEGDYERGRYLIASLRALDYNERELSALEAHIPQSTPKPTPTFSGIVQQRPQDSTQQTSRKSIPLPLENMMVDIWLDKPCGSSYKQGEKILISFKTSTNGYLTIYDIDTRGQVSVLFPNKNYPDNYVRSGQTYSIPDRSYSYDLIVEGQEGIEYVDGVVSEDPYYHWNYNQGEPRWVSEWGLNNQNYAAQTDSNYKRGAEYQNRPEGFGQEGEQSLSRNYSASRQLREGIHSNMVNYNYGAASCYFYVTKTSMSQQEEQLQQIQSVDVRRSGERLIVTMPSTILFGTDSYSLNYEARRDLDRVAEILLNFQNTAITISGHTDNIEAKKNKQHLSEYRAQQVANYLISKGIEPSRIGAVAFGDTKPIASNGNENGRQRNRRVELDIKVTSQ